MKDESKCALTALGMDLDQTLARFVGNEGLLFRFLKRFPDDKTFGQLEAAMASGDTQDGFHQAHTLKGVAGNLGLGTLFDAVTPLVETLRADDLAKAKIEYPPVQAAYRQVMETLATLDE